MWVNRKEKLVDLRVNVKKTARSKTYFSTENFDIDTGLVRLRTTWGGDISLTQCQNVSREKDGVLTSSATVSLSSCDETSPLSVWPNPESRHPTCLVI